MFRRALQKCKRYHRARKAKRAAKAGRYKSAKAFNTTTSTPTTPGQNPNGADEVLDPKAGVIAIISAADNLQIDLKSPAVFASQDSADMGFHLFPDLPTELRLKIWGMAEQEPRLIDINMGAAYKISRVTTWFQELQMPLAPVPALLYVNHESRNVALKANTATDDYFEVFFNRPKIIHRCLLFNPSVDILFFEDFWQFELLFTRWMENDAVNSHKERIVTNKHLIRTLPTDNVRLTRLSLHLTTTQILIGGIWTVWPRFNMFRRFKALERLTVPRGAVKVIDPAALPMLHEPSLDEMRVTWNETWSDADRVPELIFVA